MIWKKVKGGGAVGEKWQNVGEEKYNHILPVRGLCCDYVLACSRGLPGLDILDSGVLALRLTQ